MSKIEFQISVDKQEITIDSAVNKILATVSVDGDSTNNSFDIFYTSDWIEIERNRNQLTIFVDENTSDEERAVYVGCRHNCDSEVIAYIHIIQQPIVYSISTVEEIALPLFKEVTNEYDVVVEGGSKKYFVKSIRQYDEVKDSNGTVVTVNEVDYDNGLKLSIGKDGTENEGKLYVHSYGRTFVDETNYYKITLAHADKYRTITFDITVRYETVDRQISLSSSQLDFDYLGNATEDSSNTVFINFGDDCPDYGYTYETQETYDWLTITENPTSLTFSCDVNGDIERQAIITVKSVDDESESTILTITQEVVDYKVVIDTEALTFEWNEEGEAVKKSVNIKVYGGNLNRIAPSFIASNFTIENVASTVRTLFDEYNIDVYPSAKNTTNSNYVNTLLMGDDKSLTLTQYGKTVENDPITISVNGTTINATTTPDNNEVIVVAVSARWCNIVISGHTVSVSCDENEWNVQRSCFIVVTNSADVSKSKRVKVTQSALSSNFTMSIV